MVGRGEITDAAWGRIASLLPPNGRRGGQLKGMDIEQFLAEIREGRGHGPETDAEHRAYFRRIVREAKPNSSLRSMGRNRATGGTAIAMAGTTMPWTSTRPRSSRESTPR